MNDIEMIPLGKLRLSEANVRKNDSNLFIEELAANGTVVVGSPATVPVGRYAKAALQQAARQAVEFADRNQLG